MRSAPPRSCAATTPPAGCAPCRRRRGWWTAAATSLLPGPGRRLRTYLPRRWRMDEALWAFGRASGAVSLGLFTLSVVLGILVRSGRPLLVLPRFALTLVHRNIALLAVVFLGLHV